MTARVDCVLDAKARIGECATWDEREQVLWWVDIECRSLHRFDPGTGQDRAWPMPNRIGCFALREAGGFIVALEDGFRFFDLETGLGSVIADPEPDMPGNRMNDGTVDPRGRFVAGTMATGPREPVGGLYRLSTELAIDTLLTGLRVPNGTAFSLDGRVFYFSDSEASVRTIWACDYDPDSGEVSNRRVFVDTHGLAGRPDGGCVDAEGCYWMAGVDGWQLVRFTPKGEVDRVIEMPVERPTKVAFGGRELDILYATSSANRLTRGSESRQPQAGGIFALRLPGVRGVPTWRFGA